MGSLFYFVCKYFYIDEDVQFHYTITVDNNINVVLYTVQDNSPCCVVWRLCPRRLTFASVRLTINSLNIYKDEF